MPARGSFAPPGGGAGARRGEDPRQRILSSRGLGHSGDNSPSRSAARPLGGGATSAPRQHYRDEDGRGSQGYDDYSRSPSPDRRGRGGGRGGGRAGSSGLRRNGYDEVERGRGGCDDDSRSGSSYEDYDGGRRRRGDEYEGGGRRRDDGDDGGRRGRDNGDDGGRRRRDDDYEGGGRRRDDEYDGVGGGGIMVMMAGGGGEVMTMTIGGGMMIMTIGGGMMIMMVGGGVGMMTMEGMEAGEMGEEGMEAGEMGEEGMEVGEMGEEGLWEERMGEEGMGGGGMGGGGLGGGMGGVRGLGLGFGGGSGRERREEWREEGEEGKGRRAELRGGLVGMGKSIAVRGERESEYIEGNYVEGDYNEREMGHDIHGRGYDDRYGEEEQEGVREMRGGGEEMGMEIVREEEQEEEGRRRKGRGRDGMMLIHRKGGIMVTDVTMVLVTMMTSLLSWQKTLMRILMTWQQATQGHYNEEEYGDGGAYGGGNYPGEHGVVDGAYDGDVHEGYADRQLHGKFEDVYDKDGHGHANHAVRSRQSNEDGYIGAQDGYHQEGNHRDGYPQDGYQEDGYQQDGYHRDAYPAAEDNYDDDDGGGYHHSNHNTSSRHATASHPPQYSSSPQQRSASNSPQQPPTGYPYQSSPGVSSPQQSSHLSFHQSQSTPSPSQQGQQQLGMARSPSNGMARTASYSSGSPAAAGSPGLGGVVSGAGGNSAAGEGAMPGRSSSSATGRSPIGHTRSNSQSLPMAVTPPPPGASPAGRSRWRNIIGRPLESFAARFELTGEVLGKGYFGDVVVCVERDSGEHFACKVINKANVKTPEDAEDVQNEVAALEALRGHLHIVQLIETVEEPETVYLVMELCQGGTLQQAVREQGPFNEPQAAAVVAAAAEALLQCHSNGIIHRDVKPDNVLLGERLDVSEGGIPGDVKICDFGISTFFQPGTTCSEIVGTASFLSPEMLAQTYSCPTDIWSLGVLLHLLLSGFLPFRAPTKEAVFEAILDGRVDFRAAPWPIVSLAAKDLVSRMLMVDPDERITAEEILSEWGGEMGGMGKEESWGE
ncbi:unnamed protein product [Closterium sp. Yama58-4]|nr:unnamed protein product [Closterium sp. Yama58-4]